MNQTRPPFDTSACTTSRRSVLATFWRRARWIAVMAVVATALYIPIHRYARYVMPYPRRFEAVEAGRLYRSSQPTSRQLDRILGAYGIRTILVVREADNPSLAAERAVARKHGTRVVVLPLSGATVPTREELDALLRIYGSDMDYPILVHCEHGVARTGVAVALWRIERQDWSGRKAVAEMVDKGFHPDAETRTMRKWLASLRP